jgi:hypothetical protein
MSISIIPTKTYAYEIYEQDTQHIRGSELVDRGDWSIINSYVPGEVMTFAGALYYCLSANTGLPPTSNLDDNWSILVEVYTGTNTSSGLYILDANQTVYAHHIFFGTGTDEVDASDIPYTNTSYTTVAAALDALLYTAISITSFSNDQSVIEIGGQAVDVTLSWGLNKAPTSQSIDQGIGSLPVADRTYASTGSFTTNRTYTLTATDGTTTDTDTTSVSFLNKRYWGCDSSTGPSDATIRAFSQEFASSRVQSHVITAAAQYVFIVYPASFGTASFTVNGLPNTAWTLSVQSFTNASGYTSSYNVYRSNNLLTGTYTIAVS